MYYRVLYIQATQLTKMTQAENYSERRGALGQWKQDAGRGPDLDIR